MTYAYVDACVDIDVDKYGLASIATLRNIEGNLLYYVLCWPSYIWIALIKRIYAMRVMEWWEVDGGTLMIFVKRMVTHACVSTY